MVRRCPDCQADLDRWGDRHRCTIKIVGARQPTRLEAEQIAKGQLDPSALLPKPSVTQPVGRLAPRPSTDHPALARMPQAGCSCRADEVLGALERIAEKLDALIDKRTNA